MNDPVSSSTQLGIAVLIAPWLLGDGVAVIERSSLLVPHFCVA